MAKLNIEVPAYFTDLSTLLAKTPPSTVRSYLHWQVIDGYGGYLSKAYRDAIFDFSKTLSGVTQQKPRWKTCAGKADSALGFATGKIFVDKKFKGDSKTIALKMIQDVKDAFKGNFKNLDWMDSTTAEAAKSKADAVVQKIGYPEWIMDASALDAYYQNIEIGSSYFQSIISINKEEVLKNRKLVGKPVDKSEWDMTPPTVNAYYNPPNNEIVFPAGILQPPFFSAEWPKAFNYGAMGVVMGHEITHGFDDQGSQYDKDGNLNTWWSAEAVERFKAKTSCISEQYSVYTINGEHVNGNLTLGENIADNGGLKAAYNAYQNWVAQNGVEPRLPAWPELTPDQMFFVGFAQVWCGTVRPAEAHRLIVKDPHSPGRVRVLGTLSNSPEFARAFNCPANKPMNPTQKCTVW